MIDAAVTPDVPVAYRVIGRHEDAEDVVTLRVRPVAQSLPTFRPAQFSMIGVPGVGEVPISISSATADTTAHAFTIRRAGAVTQALVDRPTGSLITVRGPFGRSWDLERADDRHAVFVAGGIGLAPLRAAVIDVIERKRADRVSILVGAVTPEAHLFGSWLSELTRDGVEVRRSVDRRGPDRPWDEHVGFVTELIPHVVDDAAVAAYICGPDPMMSAAIDTLSQCGVDRDDMQVTLERNMQCGNGWCGHCQLGPFLLCRDGPVVTATDLGDALDRSEL